jgi:hypothetical protein
VTTDTVHGERGVVTNIPFEQEVSKVTDYLADYRMLFKGKKRYLAYTQTIVMKLKVFSKSTNTTEEYTFPHVTCNTVTYG